MTTNTHTQVTLTAPQASIVFACEPYAAGRTLGWDEAQTERVMESIGWRYECGLPAMTLFLNQTQLDLAIAHVAVMHARYKLTYGARVAENTAKRLLAKLRALSF